MLIQLCVNIDSSNSLLPDSTRPLPEPMLDMWLKLFYGIHLRGITQEVHALVNLTHCSLVMPYDDRDLGKRWLR